jgi:hypothetical protein
MSAYKIDKVKNLFDCKQCDQLLIDPVTLLCGYSVCKRHLDEQLESNPKDLNTFSCKLCDDEHCIPKKGFAINKSIQNALDIKLNPVYEECKTEINDAKINIQKIEILESDDESAVGHSLEDESSNDESSDGESSVGESSVGESSVDESSVGESTVGEFSNVGTQTNLTDSENENNDVNI